MAERRGARSFGAAGLGVLTAFWGGLSIVCVADPKSCFGSCPTFYLDEDPERPRDRRLALWMRNEALETHAVRRVRLLAAPRPAGMRVFAGDDERFHVVPRVAPPASCRDSEGSCLAAVVGDDALERRSVTDPDDLATREEVELQFTHSQGRASLVISARQSLLSTFLFYQTLAYMGRSAGDWLARVERGTPDEARSLMGMDRLLGGIEIDVFVEDGGWRRVGTFHEAGPIAGDVRVFPLDLAPGLEPLRVRLRLARGHWRISWVGLAQLSHTVEASPIELESVERDGKADARALAQLREGRRHLFTQPGDAYRLSFRLPEEPAELFLESQGYYYEWMRSEWLSDEDSLMAALVVTRPDRPAPPGTPLQGARGGGGRGLLAEPLPEVRPVITNGNRMVAATLALCVASCATARPEVAVLGRPVELKSAGEPTKGELLAVGPTQLWVMDRGGVREVPHASVDEVKVQRHAWNGKRAMTWVLVGALVTGVALTASCASVEGTSCGRVAAVVGGTWLVLGGLSAVSLEQSSTLRVDRPRFESLRPYARFPQGLPEELDPKALAPAPGKP